MVKNAPKLRYSSSKLPIFKRFRIWYTYHQAPPLPPTLNIVSTPMDSKFFLELFSPVKQKLLLILYDWYRINSLRHWLVTNHFVTQCALSITKATRFSIHRAHKHQFKSAKSALGLTNTSWYFPSLISVVALSTLASKSPMYTARTLLFILIFHHGYQRAEY